ncbi:OTU-domain-containing protein [Linderina pennispora]|uniref:OTU-domain-containing protein n=1 Tax=Linderina pennispora TaxID=61395 RepID=A0A1Y1WJ05_9FUNG|nr:OTU-domain-containing protein [Linderina pennispora]ORX73561.1 OTU-domain-containing protein [Linderina pennispora]
MALSETTIEELETRHRKETKELTSKVMSLKKSIPKGDKRKKKEVTAEIAVLEAQLAERHDAELAELKQALAAAPTTDEAKQRQQKRQEEMRRMQEEAEREAEGQVDLGQVESAAIDKLAERDCLLVHQIKADGHCLYSAFADQLNTYHNADALDYADMREKAAQYMRSHRDDFLPFMARDDGDMFSEMDFEEYCDKIEKTAEWGGQQEITALAHALEVPVHVYQMGAPVLKIGDELYQPKSPVTLSYHRHAYGLGEHYNSLRKN